MNVPNRNPRMGTAKHQEAWAEEAPKNQAKWDEAVQQNWIQPGELDPQNGFSTKQLVVRH